MKNNCATVWKSKNNGKMIVISLVSSDTIDEVTFEYNIEKILRVIRRAYFEQKFKDESH